MRITPQNTTPLQFGAISTTRPKRTKEYDQFTLTYYVTGRDRARLNKASLALLNETKGMDDKTFEKHLKISPALQKLSQLRETLARKAYQ